MYFPTVTCISPEVHSVTITLASNRVTLQSEPSNARSENVSTSALLPNGYSFQDTVYLTPQYKIKLLSNQGPEQPPGLHIFLSQGISGSPHPKFSPS